MKNKSQEFNEKCDLIIKFLENRKVKCLFMFGVLNYIVGHYFYCWMSLYQWGYKVVVLNVLCMIISYFIIIKEWKKIAKYDCKRIVRKCFKEFDCIEIEDVIYPTDTSKGCLLKDVSMFGIIRNAWIKEYEIELYLVLEFNNYLEEYLREFDANAIEIYRNLIEKMMIEESVNEGCETMDQIKSRARKKVFEEFVCA